ncbi:ferritin-like domain-containing protein [Campylobacter sp. MG1]|uniref:ferritin-like domain-containing protein n=1 Tax=Campylobacter sp. MG1 TaxID=2976332 RepID=UPI00226C9A5E|nr:ferritin-like domain-containing protein [Campylobacter sp. MG1]
MKDYSHTLFDVLSESDYAKKLAKFDDFYDDFLSNNLAYNEYEPLVLEEPSYAKSLEIIHPTRIKRPKELSSDNALAKTLHQIAHIEYSAIDLALDAAYRFYHTGGLLFASDFLEIAKEECLHFSLLNDALNELGYKYGDFGVHTNLFDAMRATNSSFKVRMGVVHRHLEACGLDANPFVVKKISSTKHQIKSKLLEVLKIILHDEISHVNKGDRWYKNAGGTNENFCDLLLEYKHLIRPIKNMNENARIMAGYTQDELDEIKKNFR